MQRPRAGVIFDNKYYKSLTTALKLVCSSMLVEYNYDRPEPQLNNPPPYNRDCCVITESVQLKCKNVPSHCGSCEICTFKARLVDQLSRKFETTSLEVE